MRVYAIMFEYYMRHMFVCSSCNKLFFRCSECVHLPTYLSNCPHASTLSLSSDCVMLSPGIVKPTRLAEDGHKLLEQTFSQMPPAATTEYRDMVNAFTQFQIEEPGTHVSEV